MDFKNKTILITGASSGIGAELAKQLGGEASTLVLAARRGQELEQLKQSLTNRHKQLKVYVFAKDISSQSNQTEIKDALSANNIQIDILINNAGIGDEALFHKSDLKRLENIIDLNIKSVVRFTHSFVPEFVANPKGKGLVFIGSGAGIAWMAGSAVYSASKHFITAMAMNLRAELKPLGLEVSLVAPGPVDTEFDKQAGIQQGMKGGPSQSTRISAEECAADIIKGLKKSKAVVVPGKKIRRLMKLYFWLPWFLRVNLLENDGKKLSKSQTV